jgi:hypothetical protein
MTNLYRPGSVLGSLLLIIAGAATTVLVLLLVSGQLSTWLRSRFESQPTQEVEEVITQKTSPSPEPSAEASPTTAPKVATTKGGQVLGTEQKSIPKTILSHYTLVYEYQTKDGEPWLTRANYDTRFTKNLAFDEVSRSFSRKVTVCKIDSAQSQNCQSGSVEVGTHQVLGLTYTVVPDQQAPTITFNSLWTNDQGQTCASVKEIKDNITPLDKLVKHERMNDGEWRDLHSEYCVSGSGEFRYQVRVKDEAGNERVSTLTFTR